jgi:hypothetical protein
MEMSKVECYVLDDWTFVSSQHGKVKSMVGLVGLYWIIEDISSGFSFCLRDSLTRELLLGLLGWREKRRVVSSPVRVPTGTTAGPRE